MLREGMIVVDKFQRPSQDVGRIEFVSESEVQVDWRPPTLKARVISRAAADALLIESPDDRCELCFAIAKDRFGCDGCGQLVCNGCLAAIPADEDRGEICEACF